MLGILIVLYGVAGSERTIKRVWDISQQANLSGKPQRGRFTEKDTLFLCLLRNLFFPVKGRVVRETKKKERKEGMGKGVLLIALDFPILGKLG